MSILLNSHYFDAWYKYSTLKAKTKEKYCGAFRRFQTYIGIQGFTGKINFDRFFYDKKMDQYSPITQNFIDEYFEFLEKEECTNSVLATNVSALKNLFQFLKSMKLIQHNPVKYYKNPYSKTTFIDRSITKFECSLLLDSAKKIDPFFRQAYIIVLLLLVTGLRNKELRELTIPQIDFDRQLIHVTRGSKTSANTVVMSQQLCADLKQFLIHPLHSQWQETGNEHVFFLRNKKLTTAKQLNTVLKKICNHAKVSPITAHSLRHTMAYLMQLEGIDTSIIQRQLRHKRLETTLRYLSQLRNGIEFNY